MSCQTGAVDRHLAAHAEGLARFTEQAAVAYEWGGALATALVNGHRLLAVGNGGSAAQAQHLTAEIVGRYRDDRAPFSAVALHTEPAALTAILNDYGPDEVFARQVEAHGRAGDICVLMSTSGRSANILAAASRARDCGVHTWSFTGPAPNPLSRRTERSLAVDASTTAAIQELHLVALHLVCAGFDARLGTIADRRSMSAAIS
jgi:D-sedoheptulose 7-phosphate isomerase